MPTEPRRDDRERDEERRREEDFLRLVVCRVFVIS